MSFFECNFFSDSLGMCVTANVIVPQIAQSLIGMKGKGSPDGCPVLYLLHGLSDDHSIWMRRTSIERYASEHGIAVVMPNIHRSYYSNLKNGLRYWDYISEELPAFINSVFKFSQKPEDTYVAGLSMGGFGTLKLTLNHPERYAAICAMSSAVYPGMGLAPEELATVYEGENGFKNTVNDLFYLAEENVKKGVKLPAMYLCCGTKDWLRDLNDKFRDHLTKLNIPFTWDEGPYEHEWAFWDLEIRKFLEFIEKQRAQ